MLITLLLAGLLLATFTVLRLPNTRINNKYPMLHATVTHYKSGQGFIGRIVINISEENEETYQHLVNSNCRFTTEELNGGMVSVCLEQVAAGDFDTLIVSHLSETENAVNKIISRFDEHQFKAWLSFREED